MRSPHLRQGFGPVKLFLNQLVKAVKKQGNEAEEQTEEEQIDNALFPSHLISMYEKHSGVSAVG